MYPYLSFLSGGVKFSAAHVLVTPENCGKTQPISTKNEGLQPDKKTRVTYVQAEFLWMFQPKLLNSTKRMKIQMGVSKNSGVFPPNHPWNNRV